MSSIAVEPAVDEDAGPSQLAALATTYVVVLLHRRPLLLRPWSHALPTLVTCPGRRRRVRAWLAQALSLVPESFVANAARPSLSFLGIGAVIEQRDARSFCRFPFVALHFLFPKQIACT